MSSWDVGELVGGYRLLKRLGRGNQAEVFLGFHEANHELRAVKVFKMGSDQPQEPKFLAMLKHPNIVTHFETGRRLDRWFMAVEYLDGGTLEERVYRQGQLNPSEALSICSDIASALSHVHQSGLVHRDIKPHNVLLARNRTVKLADFGLTCHALDGTNTSCVGSPKYIAPEIWSGAPYGPQSDLYGLGVTLYWLLSGRHPFEANDLAGYRKAHEYTPISLPDTIPRPVRALLLCVLAKDPTKRVRSASNFCDEVSTALARLSQHADSVEPRPRLARGSMRTITPRNPPSGIEALIENALTSDAHLVTLHGSYRGVQEQLIRTAIHSRGATYYLAAHVVVDNRPLLPALLHRFDLPATATTTEIANACRNAVDTPSSARPVIHVHARKQLTTRDVADLGELLHATVATSTLVVVVCGAHDAERIRSQVAHLGLSGHVRDIALRHSNIADKASCIQLETEQRWYGALRWTDDALRYAIHLQQTHNCSIDILIHNAEHFATWQATSMITSWCVLAASAHKHWIGEASDVFPNWRRPPKQWPTRDMLTALDELRRDHSPLRPTRQTPPRVLEPTSFELSFENALRVRIRPAGAGRQRSLLPLGRLGMARGLLSEADVANILEEQKHSGLSFGKIAVDSGFLTSRQLVELLADQFTTSTSSTDVLQALGLLHRKSTTEE